MSTYHLPSYDAKPAGRVKRIQQFEIPGQCRVTLYQRSAKRFAVQYGMQVDDSLTYAEACKELGAGLMHALACAGQIIDEPGRIGS